MIKFKGYHLLYVVFILFELSSLSSCSSSSSDNNSPPPSTPPSKPQQKITVSGTVSGSGGLADVTVSSGTLSTQTDNNGYYTLSDIPVPESNRVIMTFEKDGYATYQKSIMVGQSSTYTVAARMMQYHVIQQIDPSKANTLSISDPVNAANPPLATFDLPAGSLQANNNVTVNITVGDPTTEDGRSIFPGDYMAASSAGAEPDILLESVAFAEITIKDDQGKIIQLNSGMPAELTEKLPDEFQVGGVKAGTYDPSDNSKNTIAWWSYDENNGTWIREDADPSTSEIDDAKVIDVNGDLYAQAKVTHFSWWNFDQPITTHSVLCVTVVDKDGMPLLGLSVVAEGISYNGVSMPAVTDTNGKACVNVKKSSDMQQETVKLYVDQGGVRFPYKVTNPAEGDTSTNAIFTPTVQGSTINNSGTYVTLENQLTVAFDGVITGQVTKEGSNVPVAGFTIYSNYGSTATTDADGNYTLDAPIGIPVLLFAPGVMSQSVTVPDSNPLTVNFVVPNQAPMIASLTRDPSGSVPVNAMVSFSVIATDPDGDPLSYSWSANGGSFSATDTATVTWTAPATAGTYVISVTVSDNPGGQTTSESTVIVNDTGPTSGNLIFTFKDNPQSDQPLSGITVALYDADNVTIATNGVKTSGADGVVDFGNVGNNATFTVVYDLPATGKQVDSFVDVPARNIVYYVQDTQYGDYTCDTVAAPKINVTLDNIPINSNAAVVYPMGGSTTNPTAGIQNVPVCPYYIQNDGKISMLGYAMDALISESNLLGYGFVTDQTLAADSTYNISFDRSPNALVYTTSPAVPVRLSLAAIRKEVSYYINWWTTESSPGTGTFLAATEFPADSYQLFAEQNAGFTDQTNHSMEKQMLTLPQNIEISLSDISIPSLSYDATNNVVSWAISGTDPVDFININMASALSGVDPTTVSWGVILKESATQWKVMQLPSPASDWINTDNLSLLATSASMSISDSNAFNGFVDGWNYFTDGNPIILVTGDWQVTDRNIPELTPTPLAIASQALPSTTNPVLPPTTNIKQKLLQRLPLRNLLRQ